MPENIEQKVLAKLFTLLGFQKINMSNFANRLKYQKLIYLLQNYGLSLGYGYSWYVRGPYSPILTRDLFSISNDDAIFESSKNLTFKNSSIINSKIENFKSILGEDSQNPLFLEVLASMLFIKKSMYVKMLNVMKPEIYY